MNNLQNAFQLYKKSTPTKSLVQQCFRVDNLKNGELPIYQFLGNNQKCYLQNDTQTVGSSTNKTITVPLFNIVNTLQKQELYLLKQSDRLHDVLKKMKISKTELENEIFIPFLLKITTNTNEFYNSTDTTIHSKIEYAYNCAVQKEGRNCGSYIIIANEHTIMKICNEGKFNYTLCKENQIENGFIAQLHCFNVDSYIDIYVNESITNNEFVLFPRYDYGHYVVHSSFNMKYNNDNEIEISDTLGFLVENKDIGFKINI